MKYLLLFIPLLSTNLVANSVKDGKNLYLKAKCQRCHLEGAKFDPNSINKEGFKSQVGDIKGIHKWVESCDNYFNVGWFPNEINKVADYLNKTYYKLKK